MTPWTWLDRGLVFGIAAGACYFLGWPPTIVWLSALGFTCAGIAGVLLGVRACRRSATPMTTADVAIANAAKLLRECAAWEVQFGKHGLFAQAALPKDFRAELRKAADDLDATPPPEKPRASEEPGGYYSQI